MKSILFDLDGTLLNTSSGVISSIKKMMKELKFEEPDEEVMKTFIGPPVRRRMCELYNLSEEEGKSAQDVFRTFYMGGDLFLAEHYEGMEETLALLKKNFKLGVATYKREDMAASLLEEYGLAKYFDSIRGTDPDGVLTKSDIIKCCINDLGSTPEETIMVGDSDNDAIGANEIGTKFIGVTYGFGFKKDSILEGYPFADTPLGIVKIIEQKQV